MFRKGVLCLEMICRGPRQKFVSPPFPRGFLFWPTFSALPWFKPPIFSPRARPPSIFGFSPIPTGCPPPPCFFSAGPGSRPPLLFPLFRGPGWAPGPDLFWGPLFPRGWGPAPGAFFPRGPGLGPPQTPKGARGGLPRGRSRARGFLMGTGGFPPEFSRTPGAGGHRLPLPNKHVFFKFKNLKKEIRKNFPFKEIKNSNGHFFGPFKPPN